jgi:hypothetical protein
MNPLRNKDDQKWDSMNAKKQKQQKGTEKVGFILLRKTLGVKNLSMHGKYIPW